jgi:hypothetical protein
MQDAFKLLCTRTQGIDMARRLLSAITRALTPGWTETPVHFHGGANGPYVCGDPHCVSPGLDVDAR